MKLLDIKKVYQGKFLTYYIASYLNNNNDIKEYEFMSRNKNLSKETFGGRVPAGVGIIAFNEDKTKILLEREFRLATNNFVINFPGGLIDKGETAVEAAIRELKEETGLDTIDVIDELKSAYALHATSDESMATVILRSKGEIKESDNVNEEITSKFYTKEEAMELLNEGVPISARVELFIYTWAKGF